MHILNFTHPITDTQRTQIMELLDAEPTQIIELLPHFDEQQPFEPQVLKLAGSSAADGSPVAERADSNSATVAQLYYRHPASRVAWSHGLLSTYYANPTHRQLAATPVRDS